MVRVGRVLKTLDSPMRTRAKRILIIQGHPDPQRAHFGHALAEAYANGACEAGHSVQVLIVALLNFPLLRSKEELDFGNPPDEIQHAQSMISESDHIVLIYPGWNGTVPALLKGSWSRRFARPSSFPISSPVSRSDSCRTTRSARPSWAKRRALSFPSPTSTNRSSRYPPFSTNRSNSQSHLTSFSDTGSTPGRKPITVWSLGFLFAWIKNTGQNLPRRVWHLYCLTEVG